MTISDGFVSSKIYDKGNDFDFDTVNFLFLDGDTVYVLHYTGFIYLGSFGLLVSSHVADFNARNKILTAKLSRLV